MLLTTVAVAVVAHALTGLPWAAVFVLGAIISLPDAVAALDSHYGAHRLGFWIDKPDAARER